MLYKLNINQLHGKSFDFIWFDEHLDLSHVVRASLALGSQDQNDLRLSSQTTGGAAIDEWVSRATGHGSGLCPIGWHGIDKQIAI